MLQHVYQPLAAGAFDAVGQHGVDRRAAVARGEAFQRACQGIGDAVAFEEVEGDEMFGHQHRSVEKIALKPISHQPGDVTALVLGD